MDDQQQRRSRAAYLYYARWYEQERFEVWQQRQQCYQARCAEFRASVQQQFALIRAKFQAVESVLQEVMAAQADPSTAWISSWPSSTVNPHLSRSPTATSSANVASRVPPSRSRTNANCAPSGSEATTMVAGITEFSRPWRKPMSTCAMKQRRKRQSEQREKPSGWWGWSVGWERDWGWRTRIELVWTSITLPAFLTIYKIPCLSAQNRRQATFLIWLAKGQNFLGSLPSPYYIQSNEWTSTGRNEVERLVS